MLAILEDVAAGVCSTLEHRFLVDVERAHGLPVAERQRGVGVPGRNRAYCDVRYVGLATVVELDGRLGHEWAEGRWQELDRDVDSAVRGDITIRLGWGQVLQLRAQRPWRNIRSMSGRSSTVGPLPGNGPGVSPCAC